VAAGLLAWSLGFRHAFDADDIAAIDSATRQLLRRGGYPFGVGLAFSLGHSTVVLIACALVAAVGRVVIERHPWLSEFGVLFSATFLLGIGVANVATLVRRRGEAPTTRFQVRSAMTMVPVGFLFALGFDTATEVAILGLALQQSGAAVGILHIMLLPLLFAAAIMLADTTQGMFMTHAYRDGSANKERGFYDVLLTVIAALVAVILASTQLAHVAAERFSLAWLSEIDDF
jgi:high-affinity nickel-transport protein